MNLEVEIKKIVDNEIELQKLFEALQYNGKQSNKARLFLLRRGYIETITAVDSISLQNKKCKRRVMRDSLFQLILNSRIDRNENN